MTRYTGYEPLSVTAEQVEQTRDPADRIAEIEAALRPFAVIADELEATAAENGDRPSDYVGPARWDDCKRARDALANSEV